MSLLSCLVLLIFCLCDANGFRERVETVEQLAAALSRRVEHIVITKHLDLTTLPLSPRALNKEALVVEGTLLSITVRSVQRSFQLLGKTLTLRKGHACTELTTSIPFAGRL
jgi:hypothetical protein